jgi:hypothetical protein
MVAVAFWRNCDSQRQMATSVDSDHSSSTGRRFVALHDKLGIIPSYSANTPALAVLELEQLLLGPEMALRDLEQVAGGIVEVAGAYAAVPRDLVDQRDASIGQPLLPRVVLATRREECRVDRSGGAVGRRLVLRRRSLSVEQQHDALPEPEREAPSSEAERLEAEHTSS